MRCIQCQCDLEEINFRGIVVNECPNCHGLWFGRDELQKAKDNTDEDLRWLDFDPFSKAVQEFRVVPSKAAECPQCGQKVISLLYSGSGVAIDKCEQCRGVWLREGEFKKIISYLEDLVTSQPASQYALDSIKKFMDILKDPKDRTAEVKDFLVVLKLLKLRAAVEHSNIAAATSKIYQYFPFL